MSSWPVEHNEPVPATRVLRTQVGQLRRRMVAEYREAKAGHPSMLEIEKVRTDWVEAIWVLREREMDLTQKRRAAYVLRYRPIRTFTPEERAARLEATYDKLVEMGILVRTGWVGDMKPW